MKKYIVSFFVLSMLFHTNNVAQAESPSSKNESTQICNFKIKSTNYRDAYLLYDSRYTIPSFTPLLDENYINSPKFDSINDAMVHFLVELEKNHISSKDFASQYLSIDVVNADMNNILGHAFVYYNDPTIYLYSKPNYSWSYEETYNTSLHEIGHYIEKKYMTSQDMKTYEQIRKIGSYTNQNSKWEKRPEEIFAEDFRSIFIPKSISRPHKAQLPELTIEESDQIKNLILAAIKRQHSEYETLDKYRKLLNTINFKEDSYTLCDKEDNYLNSSISKKSFNELLMEYLKINDIKLYEKLNMIDVFGEFGPITNINMDSKEKITVEEMNLFIQYLSSIKNNQTNPIYLKNDNKAQFSFKDVKSSSYYYEAVQYLTSNHIIKGFPDKTFKPSQSITKEHALLFLTRAIRPTYDDVNIKFNDLSQTRYDKEFKTFINRGWLLPKSTSEIGVKDKITRQEMAKVIVKSFNLKSNNKPVLLKDVHTADKEYQADIQVMYQYGITLGTKEGLFLPHKEVSRAEFVSFVYRVIEMNQSNMDFLDYSHPVHTDFINSHKSDDYLTYKDSLDYIISFE